MKALIAQGGVRIRGDEVGDTCVADNGFCPDWIFDNFDRYVDPFFRHVLLTVTAMGIGFAIAFALALVAYRRRWFINPITQVTGILYTVPSIAAFFLLLPITGRGFTTAIIALVAYILLIIFRNVLAGLDNVPAETKDAGRGMGLTDRQLLWRVEIPLALPEIMAGLRIAVTTTVGLATLAFFAGAGGLGESIFADIKDAGRGMGLTDRQLLWRVEVPLALPEIMAGLRIAATTTVGLATLAFFAGAGGLGEQIFADITFKSNVVVAGVLAVLLAAVLDGAILLAQRAITPWTRAAAAR